MFSQASVSHSVGGVGISGPRSLLGGTCLGVGINEERHPREVSISTTPTSTDT